MNRRRKAMAKKNNTKNTVERVLVPQEILKKAIDEANKTGLMGKEIDANAMMSMAEGEAGEAFMDVIETIPEDKDSDIPKICVDVFNAFLDKKPYSNGDGNGKPTSEGNKISKLRNYA